MQVYCLDFSPEETKAVTASKDGTWVVWNIDVRYAMDEDPKVLLPHWHEGVSPILGTCDANARPLYSCRT